MASAGAVAGRKIRAGFQISARPAPYNKKEQKKFCSQLIQVALVYSIFNLYFISSLVMT